MMGAWMIGKPWLMPWLPMNIPRIRLLILLPRAKQLAGCSLKESTRKIWWFQIVRDPSALKGLRELPLRTTKRGGLTMRFVLRVYPICLSSTVSLTQTGIIMLVEPSLGGATRLYPCPRHAPYASRIWTRRTLVSCRASVGSGSACSATRESLRKMDAALVAENHMNMSASRQSQACLKGV